MCFCRYNFVLSSITKNTPFLRRKRRDYITLLWIVSCSLLSRQTFAQMSYHFRENKGQWNTAVQYRSEIPGGYIYLRKTGFTYVLLDLSDMDAIKRHMHGETEQPQAPSGNDLYIPGPGHHRKNSQPLQSNPGPGQEEPTGISAYAYRVNFAGASPDVELVPDHVSPATYNYFIGNDPRKWGRHVKEYGGVTYRNLYPHIDARVYAQSSGLKYDLIAYPGSRPEEIRLQYEGVQDIRLKNGHLHIATSLGEVIEVAPYAYQVVEGNKQEVSCSYQLEDSVVRFKIGRQYNPAYPLVIDPRLIFATFSGSTADNWGYTATYDAQGNFYMGGIVFGMGYPVTTGAFQVNFGGGAVVYNEGGFDMSISKFSPDGRSLMYATYIGGGGNEQPQSLIVNSQGNLIVAGRTTNGNSFPFTDTIGPRGGWDITLTELDATGSDLVGSLVIGGSGADGVNIADKYDTGPTGGLFTYSLRRFYGDDARSEVNIDGAGNVILVGSTQSSNFPVSPGAFQTSSGGKQDAIVLKAAGDLSSLIWSSYLGGSANDAAYVVNFSLNGDLYVAGGTESSDFPTKGSVIQPTIGGRVDGFIAEIRDDGSSIVRATYLGTDQSDQIYGIQSDKEGNVYVGGTTEGTWEVTDNAKYPGINLQGKQFLSKLKPDLSAYIYSTVFGSSNAQENTLPNISPTAFLVDRCENVYMAGWGGNIEPQAPSRYPNAGTLGLPTVNPINPRPPDGRDFYFFVLKKDAERILFASPYGQNGGFTDHVDGGTSRFDPTGVIYEAICANCGGGTIFPTGPPGVYSRQNGSRRPGGSEAGCNVVGLKIAFDLDGVRGGVATQTRRRVYCNDEQVGFVDTLYARKAYQWIWDVYNTCDTTQLNANTRIGGEVRDSTMDTPYQFNFQFPQAGCYTIRMIKYMPNDCVEYDTSYAQVRIGDNPALLKIQARKLRPCNSYRYAFDNFSTNAKNTPFSDTSFLWNFGDGSAPVRAGLDTIIHQFPGEGNYTVTLSLLDTAAFCNTPLDTSIVISISNQLKAIIQAPDTVCIPNHYLLGNASQGGTNFRWIITTPSGATQTYDKGDLSQLPVDFDEPGLYRIQLQAQDTVCGTADSTVDSVYAYPEPTAGFTFTPNNATNQVITFTDQSVSNFDQVDGELFYYWNFGDGTSSNEQNPRHLFTTSGTYRVELVVSNRAGCADTVSADVTETIIARMDVPSAFTPNGDGVNDYIGPMAFGVTKIDFRIYNRWGQMVFQTNDPQAAYLPNKGWDGRYKGKLQEMDAYAYTLHVVFNDGTEATKQGTITLIQ
jgi:gliding motility-associated-like protein